VILPVDTAQRRLSYTLEAVGTGGNGTALIIVAEEEFATQVLSTVFLTNKV
jgi:hypothetical protein